MSLYRAYSLTFDSEIDLPEFAACELGSFDAPSLAISVGAVPDAVRDPIGRGVLYEAGQHELLLRIPGVASYYVARGRRIVVQPDEHATDHEVRVFLLGSAIGAALHQRGLLVLHAAAMLDEASGSAICFAGASGAGKSTLLGEMLRRGRKMIVDDVCAVDLINGTATVLPGYPRTRLWADAAERLALETDELERTRPSIEKFERQVPEAFHGSPVPLGSLYVLTSHNRDDIELEAVQRLAAFNTLLRNTYRRRFVEQLKVMETHFGIASTAATQCRVSLARRPSGRFALEELADAIEQDLMGICHLAGAES